MANYKPHLKSSDLPNILPAIHEKYSLLEYRSLKDEELCDSPIQLVYLTSLQDSKVNKYDLRIHFKEYDRGFLEGYRSSFIPFIDTIGNRKEMVMKAIKEEIRRFSQKMTSIASMNTEDDFYKAGIVEGRRYKAWEIIFETPLTFIKYFEPAENFESKAKQRPPVIKPIFRNEAIPTIFDLLKDFFSLEHQTQLHQILETGNDASEPLIFLDNGNRLADAFKQLIYYDFITGCEKKELENWISRNFNYRYRQTIKQFRTKYLSDIISASEDKCQKPILNVKVDKLSGKAIINKA